MVGTLSPGRVCVVTQGSDAGKNVVITKVIDKNFVMIVGEMVKERRANSKHLEPTARVTETIPQARARKARVKPTPVKTGTKKPKTPKTPASQPEQQAPAKPAPEPAPRKKKEDIMVVG